MADQQTELLPGALGRVFEKLGFSSVKPEQFEVVAGILKQDVFAVLPTGFGKSACFQCLPLLYDVLAPVKDGPSIIIVVTPLTAIMKDQVSSYAL